MVYAPERLQPRHLLRPGALGNARDRCGYLAIQDFHGEFRECGFPLEELEALEKTLKAISIPLGSSVGAFDGGSGLIRIYHGREGWIDFFYRNIEQPQWNPLWAFIQQTTERFLPSLPSEMQGNFFDDPPPEDPPAASPWKKNVNCAVSLMITNSARS